MKGTVPAIPEAVKLAAIDAMGNEAPGISSRLTGEARRVATVRAVLRNAAKYAALAEVDEAALVAYLKGRL